jgi:hypothetical protein
MERALSITDDPSGLAQLLDFCDLHIRMIPTLLSDNTHFSKMDNIQMYPVNTTDQANCHLPNQTW